jgi:tetratricopeptide (TPR) repeat protein
MHKKYIGVNRAENLDWFTNVWLTKGPPVCFLQGFSGVGKSDLARDLCEAAEKQKYWQQVVINEISDRPTPSVIESLMELSATLSHQGLPEMEQLLFEETNPNLAYALEKVLQRPVVIVLDEAQRFFKADSGSPLPEMNAILSFLRNRQNLPGRLLLLSDRLVENARWSEWIPKRMLTKLEPQEAIEVLQNNLKDSNVVLDIPLEDKQDLVKSLDYNPRAIEVLVGALIYDSLDEIIGSNPGLWDTEDRVVSREFLNALERDLLERTLKHLDMAHQKQLWFLAVHRRSFKKEALEKICGSKDEASNLRTIFVTRYLINFRSGSLSLNPIVREISLSHLKEEATECKQAHSGAADYHLRHFKAKQIVGSQTRLGESFAEVRYHLVQAGRGVEIHDIGHRFTDHLKREIKSISPVPKDREELDERISVLSVLLEGGGAKGLEYHLARCLQTRGKPGDIEQAVIHAERATDARAPAASWTLLAKLKHQAEGVDAAMQAIRSALRTMADPDVAGPLYQLGAEILRGADKTDEAVVLLKEGIKVIPADKNLFSLYQSCADLLVRADKTDEAVVLLKEGIKVIPADKSLSSLYQICADMLGRLGKIDEAVALLKEGIKVIPADKSLSSLYQICADMLGRVDKIDEAVALLKEGIKVIPADKGVYSLHQILADLLLLQGDLYGAVVTMEEGLSKIPSGQVVNPSSRKYAEILAESGKVSEAVQFLRSVIKKYPQGTTSLYQSCADLLGRAGKTEDAIELLKEGIKVIPVDKNLFSLYQICADMLGRVDKIDEAVALLKEGIKVIPVDKNLYMLYQTLGEVFCRAGKADEAIGSQIEGMERIPEQFGRGKLAKAALLLCVGTSDSVQLTKILSATGAAVLSPYQMALGKVLECQLNGAWAAAAELAKTACVKFPRYFALAAQEAFSRLVDGDFEGAHRALTEFPNLVSGIGGPHVWLTAFIHLRRDSSTEGSAALAMYLGRPVDESRELNETFLLRLWDQQEVGPESHRLCFHYPIIPASLTGLKQDVHRVPFAPPVLTLQPTPIQAGNLTEVSVAPTATPEIYVSYAWGEDSTESGRKREEIVNRLCVAVEKSGRVIGRDKVRMRSGDSIDRFAQEISKAKRIVAVISEKSLHSEFCMAHELFRAFRRCDYQRAEFQEKVIALIIDDAEPLLRDNLAVVALTKVWQEKLEKFRTELHFVDPTRKSANLWLFVDLMEDMCPRLPDMLAILKDIIMKRGFEEIVKDEFQEVINLLPPRADA